MNILNFIQKDLPKIIRRYFIILLCAALVAAFITYIFSTSAPTNYEAKARLLIGPSMDSPQANYDALRLGGGLVQTYAEFAETRPILQNASDQLNLDLNASQLEPLVDVRSNNDTRIISITVQYQDPDIAINIANALSESLLNLSPPTKDSIQKEHFQGNIVNLQQSISATQSYIEMLETELESLQGQTQDVTLGDLALINQYIDVEAKLSLERIRLSEAIRTDTQVIKHTALSEKLIQDSIIRIERLKNELERLSDDFDSANYFLILSYFDRQYEIQDILTQERARLGDQNRTFALVTDTFYSIDTDPNQVTIIEPADVAIKISDFIGIKVVSSAFAGLIAALVIIILIDPLIKPAVPTVEKSAHTDDPSEPESLPDDEPDNKTDKKAK